MRLSHGVPSQTLNATLGEPLTKIGSPGSATVFACKRPSTTTKTGDFNTRSGDRAKAEFDNVVQICKHMVEHPVDFLFGARVVHSPKARDADIISPPLNRLTSSPILPILLVGGKPAGTVDQIVVAHEDGSLKRLLADAGAVIGGSERKKKKKLVQHSEEE